MNLKKNLAAKIGALVASATALLVTLGLVHQNPPPPAAAAAPAPAASATPARTNKSRQPAAPVQAAPRRHTRTHVS